MSISPVAGSPYNLEIVKRAKAPYSTVVKEALKRAVVVSSLDCVCITRPVGFLTTNAVATSLFKEKHGETLKKVSLT